MKTKTTTYQTGLWAEFLCRMLLRLKGYKIVASRYRSPAGEIDIIAHRGAVIAMIEVKARPQMDQAIEAISPRQRQRIERAAQHFLAQHSRFIHSDVRYDAMLVYGMWKVRHIANAWSSTA